MCPGGEGADLKSVGEKSLVGSNPMHSAIYYTFYVIISDKGLGEIPNNLLQKIIKNFYWQ